MALAAAQFLVNNIISVHGCVKEILAYRKAHSTGHMMQEILRLMDVIHLPNTSYHAQANDAMERAFRTFVMIKSHYTSTSQLNWNQVINFAVFTMNTGKSESTGYPLIEQFFVERRCS